MDNIYAEQIKKKRKEIYQERQNFQNQKDNWEKSFLEQKMRLEKIIEIFKEYNQNHEQKVLKLKESQKMNQLIQNYKNKDIKMQIENLKSLYNEKLTKFTDKKKILEEEKEKFEKYKTDVTNNIELKRIETEKNNLELLNLNSEINKRNNDLRNKEIYLKDKYEDYFRIKNFVEKKEKLNTQYERDLKLAAERIKKQMEDINDRENLFEIKKSELLKQSNTMNLIQKRIETEKMDVEQEKVELNLRYQNLNTFSYKIPNLIINKNNLDLNFDNNSLKKTNSNEFDKINYEGFIDETSINMAKYNNKFNANRYIKAVKDRIENGQRIYNDNYKIKENNFDIEQERQYIKKCNRIFQNK